MALDISIVATSGTSTTEVPEDVATDLAEVYETLKDLPSTRAAVVDFKDAVSARLFVKQGKAWAEARGLSFQRRGPVADNPERVTFRIVVPRQASAKPE